MFSSFRSRKLGPDLHFWLPHYQRLHFMLDDTICTKLLYVYSYHTVILHCKDQWSTGVKYVSSTWSCSDAVHLLRHWTTLCYWKDYGYMDHNYALLTVHHTAASFSSIWYNYTHHMISMNALYLCMNEYLVHFGKNHWSNMWYLNVCHLTAELWEKANSSYKQRLCAHLVNANKV